MGQDLISGPGDLIFLLFGLGVTVWAALDVHGLVGVLFRVGAWAPWRPRAMPEIPEWRLALVKWAARFTAVCIGAVLLAHFLRL